jgi:16S rRNA (guanine(527)-N(7))-methyltransferase GidB
MEKNNHKNIFNPNQLEKLDKFAELIYFENKKYNLTGLKNVKDIKNVLISESIRAINYPNLNLTDSIKVIDIGTGAGIPGIPLKIINDDVNLTLVDSNNKKCDFLKMVSSKLNISTKVICSRIED